VALAVALAAAAAPGAEAATAPSTPVLTSAPYVSPAVFTWTPGADLLNTSQTILRSDGACTSPLAAGQVVRVYADNTTAQHFAQPGDGTWCFSVQAADALGGTARSGGLTVTIDTTPPVSTLAIAPVDPTGVVKGRVTITHNASDAVSGVAADAVRIGPVGACPTGRRLRSLSWDTTTVADGRYDICAIVTDRAGFTTTATLTVTVVNAQPAPAPVPSPVQPAAAAPPAAAVSTSAPEQAKVADTTAPGAPSRISVLRPRTRSHAKLVPLRLRWVNPASPDFARVVVVLNAKHAPRTAADGSVVYRGRGTGAGFKLRAGAAAHLALFAYDRSGNVSRPARKDVSLAALIPLRPVTGSVVQSAPLLTWKAVPGVAYYNVQLFRNGRRVITEWPTHASLRLDAGKLEGGTYTWFVWPALKGGSRASATFGDLIGRATFAYRP
jgi:hypothetical protein